MSITTIYQINISNFLLTNLNKRRNCRR